MREFGALTLDDYTIWPLLGDMMRGENACGDKMLGGANEAGISPELLDPQSVQRADADDERLHARLHGAGAGL